MKRWMAACGMVAMASSGCEAVVLEPLGLPAGPPATGPSGDSFPALALRMGDVPDAPPGTLFIDPYLSESDPDALVLFFSSAGQRCATPVLEPDASALRCLPGTGFWQLSLAIPSRLARPGLIDLTDFRLGAAESMWGLSGSCTGKGGVAAFQGTLEIVRSDATSVAVKLRAGPRPGWPAIDGDYTAHRCGDAPPIPPPTPALAIRGAHLPASASAGEVDPDALFLFLGTAAATCAAPLADLACTGAARLALRLPPSLQSPGVIALADPALQATYAVSQGLPTSCPADDLLQGTPAQGTIEILDVDASGVSFKVYGSGNIPATDAPGPAGTTDFDGLYAASLCP